MLIPFMLPEAGISLTIAGPVSKHCALQVREEAEIKGTVTLGW